MDPTFHQITVAATDCLREAVAQGMTGVCSVDEWHPTREDEEYILAQAGLTRDDVGLFTWKCVVIAAQYAFQCGEIVARLKAM